MIDELDQILKDMLDDGNAPDELRNADVSFEIPKEKYTPSTKTVNLYLYDVHENRALRDPIPIGERVGDINIRRKPPLRVDCSYMVTAWSITGGEGVPDEEHRLLSLAMLWLSQFPTIPVKKLPLEWKDKNNSKYQPFPVLMWVAQANGVKEPGEFWAALGSPPRPFFNLVVTIAMDLRKEIIEGPPVTIKVTTYGQKIEDKEEIIQKPETEEDIPVETGEISNIEENKFVLVTKDKNINVSLKSDTFIMKNGKEAKIEDLNEGDKALVSGKLIDENNIIAKYIEIPTIPSATEELIQIGGRVFDAADPEKGIKGAKVLLVELNKIETTDEEGRFSFPSREKSKSFPGLTPGEYNLKIFASGFDVKEQKIEVPGSSEEYEIGLSRAGP